MLTSLTTVGEEDKNSSFTNPHYITFEGPLFLTHSQSDLPRLTNVYLTKKAFCHKKKVTTNSLLSVLSSHLDITPALQKYLDSLVCLTQPSIHDGTPNKVDSHPSTPQPKWTQCFSHPCHNPHQIILSHPYSPSHPFFYLSVIHSMPSLDLLLLFYSILFLSLPIIQFHYSLSSPLLHFPLSPIPQSLSSIPPHPSVTTSFTPISSQSNHHHTITLQTPSLKSPSQL